MIQKFIWHGDDNNQVDLGDVANGDVISEGPSSTRPLVDSVPLYGAAYPRNFDSGNRVNTIAWSVERLHDNAADAADFRRSHEAEIATIGVLEEVNDAGSRFLQNAAMILISCNKRHGASSNFEYQVRGGEWTENLNAV